MQSIDQLFREEILAYFINIEVTIMSNSIGPAFSLSPGETIGLELGWNNPGWQGILVWVPQPLEAATVSFGSQSVILNANGTFSFGQNFTNDTDSVIDIMFQWSSL
jgi:hypothetical protein